MVKVKVDVPPVGMEVGVNVFVRLGATTVSVAFTLLVSRLVEALLIFPGELLYVPPTLPVTEAVMLQLAVPAVRLPPVNPMVVPPTAPVTVPPHCGEAGTAANVKLTGRVSVNAKPI